MTPNLNFAILGGVALDAATEALMKPVAAEPVPSQEERDLAVAMEAYKGPIPGLKVKALSEIVWDHEPDEDEILEALEESEGIDSYSNWHNRGKKPSVNVKVSEFGRGPQCEAVFDRVGVPEEDRDRIAEENFGSVQEGWWDDIRQDAMGITDGRVGKGKPWQVEADGRSGGHLVLECRLYDFVTDITTDAEYERGESRWILDEEEVGYLVKFFDYIKESVKDENVDSNLAGQLEITLEDYVAPQEEEDEEEEEDVAPALPPTRAKARLLKKTVIKASLEPSGRYPGYLELEDVSRGGYYGGDIASQALEETNFDEAVSRLKGASGGDEGRDHWLQANPDEDYEGDVIVASGSVYVYSGAPSVTAEARQIIEDLEGYSILDEDGFSQREDELIWETIESEGTGDISKTLGYGHDASDIYDEVFTDEDKDLFNQVPEDLQPQLLKEMETALAEYPYGDDELKEMMYALHSHGGGFYANDIEEIRSAVSYAGHSHMHPVAPAEDFTAEIIRDFIANEVGGPGSKKNMEILEKQGQQRLPLESKLTAAPPQKTKEMLKRISADPVKPRVRINEDGSFEEIGKATPKIEVTEEDLANEGKPSVERRAKPITQIEKKKPQDLSIDMARTAEAAPATVEGLLASLSEDAAKIGRVLEKINRLKKKYLARYEETKKTLDQKQAERLGLLAQELRDRRLQMVTLELNGIKHALAYDEGTASQEKIQEVFWSEEGKAKLESLQERRSEVAASLKAVDEAIQALTEEELGKEGGVMTYQPRILEFPLEKGVKAAPKKKKPTTLQDLVDDMLAGMDDYLAQAEALLA